MLPNMIQRRQRLPKGPGGRPPSLPTELMHVLVKDGLTNKEIAAELWRRGYGRATSSALSAWRKRHGYPLRQPTDARLALIPWVVAVEHANHRYYICLALAARARVDPDRLSLKDRGRLDKFLRELAETGAVIHYDRVNGWTAVRPREGIDNDLIREPRIADDGTPIDFNPRV